MQQFTIHGIPGSPFARAVLMAMEEKHAQCRFKPVSIGSLKADQHLAIHPFGRIPTLDHGSFRLFETQAILRYIDRVLTAPALTPVDPQAAGRMDQLMNINDWYLFQGVANVIGFQRIVGPRLMGLATDLDAISAAMTRARTVFAELARELGEGRFFVGDSISLADIILAPQLSFLKDTPEWETLSSPHSNLRAWLDRMQMRPSMMATTWERVVDRAAAA